MKEEKKEYLNEIWNLFDCAFIFITITYIIYDLFRQGETCFNLRLFSSLSILLSSVKILTYFRAI